MSAFKVKILQELVQVGRFGEPASPRRPDKGGNESPKSHDLAFCNLNRA
jgi:hypothetical protein